MKNDKVDNKLLFDILNTSGNQYIELVLEGGDVDFIRENFTFKSRCLKQKLLRCIARPPIHHPTALNPPSNGSNFVPTGIHKKLKPRTCKMYGVLCFRISFHLIAQMKAYS